MSRPNFNGRAFDGPRKSGADLPSPPPSGGPTRRSFARYRENSYPESDDEEYHDAPHTQTNQRAWGYKSKEIPQPSSTQLAAPSVASSLFIARRILHGYHHNATFEGTSQYARGGSSACGLASMNAIRLAFDYCDKLTNNEELLSRLVSEDFVKDAMAIAASWPDEMHLEVEPILELPLFSTAFQLLGVRYGVTGFKTFSEALIALQSDDSLPGPRAAFLTRPPEMIAVMHIPLAQHGTRVSMAAASRPRVQSIYLVFDSHPRPDHPDGAAVQIFPSHSIDNVADYLTELFQVDKALMEDPNLEWHVQLLGQVSSHLLAPAANRETQGEYVLNMRCLTLAQRVTEAEQKLEVERSEKRELQAKCTQLEQEVGLLTNRERMKDEEIRRLKAQQSSSSTQWSQSFLSWGRGSDDAKRDPEGKGRNHTHGQSTSSKRSGGDNGTLQLEFSSWSQAPDRPQTLPDRPWSIQSRTTPNSFSGGVAGKSLRSKKTNSNAGDPDGMGSLQLALTMQRAFDDERQQISLEESIARAAERPKFNCGICAEKFTDEAIALVDGCNHSCCRDCMREVIQSAIEERRYPILCPICMAESDGSGHSGAYGGTILASLVETIGVSDDLFGVFTEMQLADHSVMIDCRGCLHSTFVDRDDYNAVEIIACPIRGCSYSWCKQCNQSREEDQRHSCDGSEWEVVMNPPGRKRCPGCRNIQRFTGCNHLTCTTPGCNTHFCCRCGMVVAGAGTRREIQEAVSSHFRFCPLFDVVHGA